MRSNHFAFAAFCLGATLLSSVAHADFFTSQSAFNASNPGLPILTFEGIAPVGSFLQPAPPFAGVTFTDATSGTSDSVDISSATFFSTPTDVLFLNAFDNGLVLTFAPDVNAVGFNLASGFGGGGATLTVFNGATLLDTETVTTTSESDFTTFTGFSNLGTITSLTITPQLSNFILIDNLAFGASAPPSVPEPGSLALLVGLSISGAGFLARRRKNARKAA